MSNPQTLTFVCSHSQFGNDLPQHVAQQNQKLKLSHKYFLISDNRRHCSDSSSGKDHTVFADSSLKSLYVNVAETNP